MAALVSARAGPSVRKTLTLRVLSLPVAFVRSDHILCSVTWPTDERVAVQWLTREQNYLLVQTYDFDGTSWRETQVGRRVARVRSRLTRVSLRTSQLESFFFLAVEIRAKEQDGLDRPRECRRSSPSRRSVEAKRRLAEG